MNESIPAIFLDRDGTINRDYGYVYKIDNFQFIAGAIEAMSELKKMGYILILVTNQSGIARGLFRESQFLTLTEWMYCYLINHGVELDGIYYCPHHPEAIEQKYRQICHCRKPKSGMLLEAQKDFNINMNTSYMVGNNLSDMQAGKEANIGTNMLVSLENYLTKDDKKYVDWIINGLVDVPYKVR